MAVASSLDSHFMLSNFVKKYEAAEQVHAAKALLEAKTSGVEEVDALRRSLFAPKTEKKVFLSKYRDGKQERAVSKGKSRLKSQNQDHLYHENRLGKFKPQAVTSIAAGKEPEILGVITDPALFDPKDMNEQLRRLLPIQTPAGGLQPQPERSLPYDIIDIKKLDGYPQ